MDGSGVEVRTSAATCDLLYANPRDRNAFREKLCWVVDPASTVAQTISRSCVPSAGQNARRLHAVPDVLLPSLSAIDLRSHRVPVTW